MKERKNERMNDTHSGFLILEDEEQTACVKLNDKDLSHSLLQMGQDRAQCCPQLCLHSILMSSWPG